MSRPLVIGIGNPLRGDDGLGPRVAEMIADTMPEVDIIATHQLTPELAEAISAAAVVVFVDADADAAPGEIRVLDLGDANSQHSAPFSHHVDPATLLTLAARLFGRCPPATLVTVGPSGTDFGEMLSPAATSALPLAITAVVETLRSELR